jgi:hypothetical protein
LLLDDGLDAVDTFSHGGWWTRWDGDQVTVTAPGS